MNAESAFDGEIVLAAESIEKSFGGSSSGGSAASRSAPLKVLEQFSISVHTGEFVTLVGPSGCGKSTLLRVLGGFLPPDAGRVLFRGKVVDKPGPERVMMFQEFDQLFPWKSVAQNVEFPLKTGSSSRRLGVQAHRDGTRERKRRVKQILEEVGLRGYEDYYPHQLSGGMKQRTALARTLLGQPELVLMDEPFGSVDARKREELQALLLSLQRKHNFTVVFVTHDIQEAVYLADRVLVMEALGKPVQETVPVEVERPRDRQDRRLQECCRRISVLLDTR
ncbi:MAG: ABC transporter ATP-binding protein [Spirochaetaceae bacterium]